MRPTNTRQTWSRVTRVDLRAEDVGNAYAIGTSRPRVLTVHRSLKPLGFDDSKMGLRLSALTWRTGQQGRVTVARKGAARLGLRAGAMSGAKVTLRGASLDAFRDRFPRATRVTDRMRRPFDQRMEGRIPARRYAGREARTVRLCWSSANPVKG